MHYNLSADGILVAKLGELPPEDVPQCNINALPGVLTGWTHIGNGAQQRFWLDGLCDREAGCARAERLQWRFEVKACVGRRAKQA